MAFLQYLEINRNTSTLPIPLVEVKDYLKVDYYDEDNVIRMLIWAAVQGVERYTGRIIVPAECKAIYTQQGGDLVKLYYSDNIALVTGSSYVVDGDMIRTSDEYVSIEYTAGYSEIPQWAKSAILANIAFRYEHRGDEVMEDKIDPLTKSILKPFVKWALL